MCWHTNFFVYRDLDQQEALDKDGYRCTAGNRDLSLECRIRHTSDT